MLEKCRFWGEWDIGWQLDLPDIIAYPVVKDKQLIFKVKKVSYGKVYSERNLVNNHEIFKYIEHLSLLCIYYNVMIKNCILIYM